jgi:hypothetical protein
VPVPFPADGSADTSRPRKDEAWLSARAFASACAPEGGLTPLQEFVVRGLTQALTADLVELGDITLLEPITPEAYAEANANRDRLYRIRRVQTMVLLELLLRPLPDDVTARVEAFADALGLGDDCRDMVAATRHLAAGSTEAALADFMRNGYEVLQFERSGEARPEDPGDYWVPVLDAELAARWASMEHLGPESLGRRVWEFYKGRGFNFPGTPNSVSPRLAQHDFVHVLADYGTTVESELEVFGLISRASDDPRAFTLLIQVLGLFEAGYLQAGMGLFQMDVGHLSADEDQMAIRLGDALKRGAWVAWQHNLAHGIDTGVDFLAVDWFAHADKPLDEVRSEFFLVDRAEKSAAAIAAGSVGPWEPGGISPFQATSGRAAADAEGRPYESYGAEPRLGAS